MTRKIPFTDDAGLRDYRSAGAHAAEPTWFDVVLIAGIFIWVALMVAAFVSR